MKAILLCLLIFAAWIARTQNIDDSWVQENYTKKEVYITMRDGIKLFTSLYIPKNKKEKHPILIIRTPYSCSPYGETNFSSFWKGYQKEYLREGYIIVHQDVRGKFMSEGQFIDIRPFKRNKKGKEIDETSDTFDTIDWLIKNIEGNNGNVGVFGTSYPGFYATMAAACNHPALKAVSPQAPVTNWFMGDDFHHNGAFFQMDAFSFFSAFDLGFGVPRPKPVKEWPVSVGNPMPDIYNFYLETACIKNLTKLTGDTIRFWNEIIEHPNYDVWWKARDARNATKNLKPAMLWVGGLFDAENCWGTWNAYDATEKNNPGKEFNKIVVGPWSHGQWAGRDGTHLGYIQFGQNTCEFYQQNFEVPFFNFYLKGKGDISQIAEANIFITGLNKWSSFNHWPPSHSKNENLYLMAGGKLSLKKPTSENGFDEYTSDPAKPVPYESHIHSNRTTGYMLSDQRFAACRPDVLVYQTDTLTKDIIVTGSIIAEIIASISTTDIDFVIKIIDVFPNDMGYSNSKDGKNKYPMGGYQMLVRGDVFRGRYRNSFEKPKAFTPGKIEKIEILLPSIAHCFKKGHRIMLQIQSSWFPLVDRNPQQFLDIYHCDETDFIKSSVKIYHNVHNASKIILPILKDN